jgi:hypothetical protein
MKTILSVFLILFILSICSAQNTSGTGFKPNEKDLKQKKLEKGMNYDVNFDVENHDAFFAEGLDSLFRLLYAQLDVSEEALNANLVSTAMIGFQVNFDGKVQNVKSIAEVGYGIDGQLSRALEKVEFYPATQGNMPYRSEVVLEIPIKAAYLNSIYKKRQ